MEISFKETKDLDYNQVVNIFFEVGFLKHPKKRQVYKKAIEKAFCNSQYVVGVWDKDMLIGFTRVLTDGSLFATVWNMIVKPEYQNKGIGKKLMQKCLDKYPKCHFFLIADEKVSGFYKKAGFDIHSHGMYLEKGREVCIIYN